MTKKDLKKKKNHETEICLKLKLVYLRIDDHIAKLYHQKQETHKNCFNLKKLNMTFHQEKMCTTK